MLLLLLLLSRIPYQASQISIPDEFVAFVGLCLSFVVFSLSFVAFVVFVGFVRTGPSHGSSGPHGLTGSWAHGLMGSRAHGLVAS